MKKILLFLGILIPWFLSSLIPFNEQFYTELTLPFFTPPRIFFPIAWSIVYIGIALSIYGVIKHYELKELPKDYLKVLLINYAFNQLFVLCFFTLENTFLGFTCSIFTFITSLFLYEETSYLDKKSTKYLNPYVLLSLFATILSLTIYILNV